MPTQDGLLSSRDICDGAVLERTLADESVGSLKIQKNLQSDNFVTGTSGWEINRDTGSVEFQDATIRGTLNASDITSGTMSAARIGAGTITAVEIILTNSASAILRSSNYSAGSAGWRIRGDGDAEFNDVTIRGTLSTNTITGNLTMDGTGAIRTNSSGTRVEIDQSGIDFFDASGSVARLWVTTNAMNITDLGSGGVLIEQNDATGSVLQLRSVSEPELFHVQKTGADSADVTIGTGNLNMDNGNIVLNGDLNLQDSAVTEWTLRAGTSDQFQLVDDDGTTRMLVGQNGATDFSNDAGDLQLRINASRQVLADETRGEGSPAFAFINDTDTGMFRVSTNVIAFATNGVRRMSISSVRSDFDTGNLQDHVMRVPVKTTSGNPTGTFGNGDMYLNTTAGTNGTLRMFGNGAWRDVQAL